MKYQHKKNFKVAELIETNDKSKMVTLQYEEDGTYTSATFSTFQRWWKKIDEDQPVETVIEEVQTSVEEDTASDGTPYTEVMNEILQDEKKAVKQAKRQKKNSVSRKKKEICPEVTSIMDFVLSTAKAKGWEIYDIGQKSGTSVQAKSLKVDGHMFCLVRFSAGSVKIACREKAVQEVAQPDKTVNHMFDAIYVFEELTTANKTLIKDLMMASAAYQKAKKANTIKTTKTKKEEK